MTVEAMLNSMSSEEITYWMAFFALEKEDFESQQRTQQVKNSVKR
jgi:hypothetical protein